LLSFCEAQLPADEDDVESREVSEGDCRLSATTKYRREKRDIMQRKDNSSLTKVVGKRLSALRESKKMSQEEFAKRVGISRGYLSDLERGVREMSLATLAIVCKKSGTTPNKLLGWQA
jgi:DNA-binding transcriptional regulator YiaG